MLTYKINIQDIKNQIFIPKYYDPALRQELLSLKETHDLLVLGDLIDAGFIGLYRDEETLQPVEYFCKLPQDIAERDVLVLDPMLATGGSAIDAITQIKKHGAKRIKFIGLIAAPEGIEALHKAHPDVDIYLGAKDDHLNENGYIVPGLGDAGDRIYGTK